MRQTITIALLTMTLAAACSDGTGLDLDDGGRPDAKIANDGPISCLTLYCPLNAACQYGYETDDQGCPTCACKLPPLCEPVACRIYCEHGYKKDAHGCETCACNPPPTCPPPLCLGDCPHGSKRDENGCETCQCLPPPEMCTPDECGPTPAFAPSPPYCPDGAMPLPAVCERNSDGKCGWKGPRCPDECSIDDCANLPMPLIDCVPGSESKSVCVRKKGELCQWQVTCEDPVPCNEHRDLAACLSPRCIWLDPGCGQGVPSLSSSGCFDRKDVDCGSQNPCRDGRQCLKRGVNPACQVTSAGVACPVPPPSCNYTRAICL